MWRPDALLMGLTPVRRAFAIAGAAWKMDRERPRLSRSNAELAFLPAVIEIAETPASPLGRITAAAIMALVVAALTWASLGHVDIHATAQGRIITVGKTKAVAPPETASVAAIHVKDGDHVIAGQVLVELDPIDPNADATRARRERVEELVTSARLHALLDGRSDITLPQGLDVAADLLDVHRAELRQKLADHRSTIASLEKEKEGKEAAAASAQSELERLIQTVPVAEQRARAKQEAADGGFGSRDEYLAAQQDWIDRKQKLEGARHDLKNAQSGIADAEAKLRQSEAQFRTEALDKLAEADQKAASLAQDLAKADERSRLFRLTAPVDGVVQQLAVHAPGAVVSQAQPILMVVPADEGIVIDAMLQNKDAGFVHEGQPVEIKVESFPFTRYGTIPGRVVLVSGDTVQNGDSDQAQRRGGANNDNSSGSSQSGSQEPVYAVQVRPLTDHIHADGRDVALAPGMAVTAEIKTGRRRVISYVLDPVARYWGEGLRER